MGLQDVGKEVYPMIRLEIRTHHIHSTKKGQNLPDCSRLPTRQQVYKEGHHTTPQYPGCCRKPQQ
jgi:hypothetical protein